MPGFPAPPSLDAPYGPVPPSRFLSNGCYKVLITSTGTGFSMLGDHALTRWSGDRVNDTDGFFIYLRDLESREVWSAGLRPTLHLGDSYQSRWRPGVFEIERVDHGIRAHLSVCTPRGENLEMRRLTLSNGSGRRRVMELTSFAEVVLNDPAAHAAHPAFSKLFLQTAYDPDHRALLARRRPRAGERHPWMVHALLGRHHDEFETDRTSFLGRGRRRLPRALRGQHRLSGATGNVLDPALSLRCVIGLEPGEEAEVTFLLGASAKRISVLAMAKQYASGDGIEEAFTSARSYEESRLEKVGICAPEAEYLQALAGAALYGHPGLRAGTEILERAEGSPEDLARYDIVANRALAVLHAESPAGAAHLNLFLKAQRYWQALGLPIDVLVLTDETAGDAPDDLRTLPLRDIPPPHRDLIDSVARLVVTASLPDLASTPGAMAGPLDSRKRVPPANEDAPPRVTTGTDAEETTLERRGMTTGGEALEFWNGFGGFSPDGNEYVIPLPGTDDGPRLPPRPWINVIANERFGFLVSETGAGYTWSRNSREHRLTPWSNDPLTDPHGEAFYIRDDETGAFWSPLPGPAPGSATYEMRHGFGYSLCRHTRDRLEQEAILFVPRDDPVKITGLHVTNNGIRTRRLSFFSYYRLALGTIPEETGRFVVTEMYAATAHSNVPESDPKSCVLFARNGLAGEFSDGVTFAAVVAPTHSLSVHATCDRDAFIGRHGSPESPAALQADTLNGRTGAALDPCMAQQATLEIPPGETIEVIFLFGEESDRESALSLMDRYAGVNDIRNALSEVRESWQRRLSGVKITTPSRELDLLMNGWLAYQTLACRIWARSALYQSGGAFGFRDQLQDAAALVYLSPDLTRRQLLLHAAHQFVEGDVLHWWHPPKARGLRTRFADDLLWLPYLTAHYIQTTGDREVLDEVVPFMKARHLEPGEDEVFLEPEGSGESADLYEHCCRAVDRSLTKGRHGLPLFGTGDWNDGMNRVGREGKGESVWMGFFLYDLLGNFIPICRGRGDMDRVGRCTEYREQLLWALNDQGWDGEWYRRGFYDNGATLGSHRDAECRIDALAQAWSILSGAAPESRASSAMDSVERHLISEEEGIIRLLTPPFDKTPNDPGYIRGYVRGVRENGGQYTHVALWVVRALAELGRNDRVARLLNMISPITHTRNEERVGVYQGEPYVVAADIYGADPHVGRAGWTWYTGSSGWMYRVALESLLGFTVLDGQTLVLKPCVPDDWPHFTIEYRLPGEETRYSIRVVNPQGRARSVVAAAVDGVSARVAAASHGARETIHAPPATIVDGSCGIALQHDGRIHNVEVVLGP